MYSSECVCQKACASLMTSSTVSRDGSICAMQRPALVPPGRAEVHTSSHMGAACRSSSDSGTDLGHQLDVLILQRRRDVFSIQRVMVAEVHDESHFPACALLRGQQVADGPWVRWRLILLPASKYCLRGQHDMSCLHRNRCSWSFDGVPCTAHLGQRRLHRDEERGFHRASCACLVVSPLVCTTKTNSHVGGRPHGENQNATAQEDSPSLVSTVGSKCWS